MSGIGDGFVPNSDRATQHGNTQGDPGIKSSQNLDAWGQPIREAPVKKKIEGEEGNDAVIDDEDIDNIWSDVKTKKKVEDQAPPVDNKQQQQIDPKKQLQDYMDSQGLGKFELSDATKAEIAEGKFEGLQGQVLGLVQQAHAKALSGASALIDAKVAKAVEEAGNKTKSYIAGKDMVEALHRALPFTKDPAIGPVAQSVMQKFLDRNASMEQAIEGVKRWSAKFVNLADPGRQVNPNRNGSFRDGSENENGTGNWLTILTGKGQ